ncbi:MAG: AAA family ATPase [Candidatus Aenigmatarchaeota archaeon]|nr:MAG: AAA family ATPase [Candidatus Aenigmarchaeota archaeon]
MITKISLKNWKSHLDSEFDFSKGVNAIIGIMGSGKTSIVQALTFALFGTFPAIQSRKITLDDLIMKKPQKKSKAEVSLDFKIEGKNYSIKRVIELGKGTSHAEIGEDGRLLDVNPQGVNRIVQNILQMDYDLFSKAVYSEQNRLDYFLSIPKGQRMQHIDRMLKLDRFEKVRENAVSLANRISQGRMERMKLLGELEKENLGERIRKISKDVRELGEEREEFEKGLRKVKLEKEKISEMVTDYDEMEDRINKIRVEIKSVRTGMEEIEDSLKVRRRKLKDMEPEEIPKVLEKLEKEIETLEEEVEKREGDFEEDREMIASVNAEIKNIKDQISEMERLGDKCPTCESPITEGKRKKLVDVRKGKEMVLRNKANNLAKKMEKDKKHIKLLEEQLKERVLRKEKLGSFVEDIDYIKGIEDRRRDYEKREAALKIELEEIQGKLGDADIKDLRKELQERIAREREVLAKLSGLEEKIEDREESLQDLRDRESMFKKYKESIKKDEIIAERLNTFVKVLKVTQDQLRQEFLKNVNHSMGMIWGELYPYGDFSEVRLVIDKDYVLQIKGSEGWVSVEGVASGGERSIASLALRVAFSMALVPNLKWLILDEPTHNLDVNAIEQFTGVLREKINNFVEQVFLITHEERVSEGILGSLYKLERNKEMNEPTRIVGI